MNYELKARELFPRWDAQGHADHRAWARRILWRAEQGDKTVSVVQAHFASEALGVA